MHKGRLSPRRQLGQIRTERQRVSPIRLAREHPRPRHVPQLAEVGDRRLASFGKAEEHAKGGPGPEVVHVSCGRDRAAVVNFDLHPGTIFAKQIGRQEGAFGMVGIESLGELPRGRRGGVVVGQRFDLVGGQGESLDDSGQPRLKRSARRRRAAHIRLPCVFARLRRPVEHGPKIALKDRSLERIVHERFSSIRQEFVEDRDRSLVSFSFQQIFGVIPEIRVQPVSAVFPAVRPGADPQSPMQAVPEVTGIVIVDRDFLGLVPRRGSRDQSRRTTQADLPKPERRQGEARPRREKSARNPLTSEAS